LKTDKHQAIQDILNITDHYAFIKKSGFLEQYILEVAQEKKISVESFYQKAEKE